ILDQQAKYQAVAVTNADKATKLAYARYKAGLVALIEVLDAQSVSLQAERDALFVTSNQLLTTIALIKALGGGWEGRPMPTPNMPAPLATAKQGTISPFGTRGAGSPSPIRAHRHRFPFVTIRALPCPMALLEIHHVTRRFGDFAAVDGVSLSIAAGEFFTLLGPSGCGKTTLLRMVAGFDAPDDGRIVLDGKDMTGIAPEARNVHTVFQSYALFPHMTVEQNIAFPLRMARGDSMQLRARVAQALEQVQLGGFGRRYPNELSGGQRQRVAVARA